jgi:serine protease AprX
MKKIRFLLNILILLVFLFGLTGSAHQANMNSAPRAQHSLIQLAETNPEQWVAVIVQKEATGGILENMVSRLGGRVTQDLGIIHAFAAQMPAKTVLKIAMQPEAQWVSLDAQMESTACTKCIDTSALANAYIGAIRADKVWNSSLYLQGNSIGVAVVDSGVNPNGDLYTTAGVNRLVANIRYNTDYNQSTSDGYGHGTHVSSIIGGDGSESGGKYIGVAPMANIINVKVSNDNGSATMKDVISGLQWVLENKNVYNIRVVNLSLNSAVNESYNTNPLDAAVEVLWFNGIVVVVSAGNQATGVLYPPANDPFVITVGAVDDKGTNTISDDAITTFSAYGKTENGNVKPDLVAPGKNIVARLVNSNMGLAGAHPSNLVGGAQYFRMSGTSMAAPMVSGAVALLLQDEPGLTPDQVKYRLKATANKNWSGYNAAKAGEGYLDVFAAVNGSTTQSSNTGMKASNLLTTGTQPVNSSVSWNSVSWNSVSWNSVSWNSVSWNSVSWNSVSWNSDYWGN